MFSGKINSLNKFLNGLKTVKNTHNLKIAHK